MFVPSRVWILFFVHLHCIENTRAKAPFRIDSFNEIVQNITHINSVIQEFIKNYKQLQDIYKSVEVTEPVQDDVSDYVKRNKDAKYEERKTPKPTTTEPPLTLTPVFYSEEHHWKDVYDLNYYFESEPKKKHISGQDFDFQLKSESRNPTNLHKRIYTTTTTTKPTDTKILPIITTTIFTDISDENDKRETNEVNELSDLEQVKKVRVFPKNREKIKSHETKDGKEVRKVITYETFDDDMWQSIIESRPIRYEYDKANLRRTSDKVKKKTALILIKKLRNNRMNKKGQSVLPEDKRGNSENVLSSELKIENVILRAKGNFGKACFRYVVRRCYLALNQASKNICKDLGCKKNFRRALKEAAKESCQNEFYGQINDNNTTTTTTKITTAPPKYLRNETVAKKDLTRRKHTHVHKEQDLPSLGPRYLSTCYPHMLPASARRMLDSAELPDSFLKAIASAEIPNHSGEANILRNKYERACKKESAKRCKKSGKKTIAVVCERYPKDCKKKTRSSFTKHTGKMCMDAFGVKKKQSDDYSDDESCSSDTGSSSESNPFD